MNVQSVGGTHPALMAQPPQGAVRPEAAERPGTPDHDGDSDEGAVKVELSKQA